MSNQVYPTSQNSHITSGRAVQAQAGLNIRDAGVSVTIANDKYIEYNFFVKQYNNDANRIGNVYMLPIPVSRTTRSFSCSGYICLILCAILLYLSIPTFVYLCFRFTYLIIIYRKVKRNKQFVPDPFKRMVYCPGISQVNIYLDITPNISIQELSVLGISTESFNVAAAQLRSQNFEGRTVRVMFYNNQFASFCSNVSSDLGVKLCLAGVLLIVSFISALFSIIIITGS